MHKQIKQAVFVLLFLCSKFLFSQSNTDPLFFEKAYTLHLQDINSVTFIFKDSHHIMWYGTQNGLYRFDGVNLHYFKHTDGDTTSLADNVVMNIAEDKKGHLWVGLLKGITAIDLQTLKCTSFTSTNKRFDEHNYTNWVCTDSENVWVGNNVGIFKLDEVNRKFVNVWQNRQPQYALSSYVTCIINGEHNQLIASTFHDIIFLDKSNYSYKRVPVFVALPPKDSSVTCVMIDSKHTLWIGTWGNSLYRYDIANNKLSHVDGMNNIFKKDFFYVTSLYETNTANEQIVWAGTSNGLVKCSINGVSAKDDFVLLQHDKAVESSIIPGKIQSLYFDDDGALWCGGDEGICRCFPFHNNFKYFASLQGMISDIQQISITGIPTLIIGSWNSADCNGFLITDTAGKQVFKNTTPGFTDKEYAKNVSGVVKDKYNRLWISTMAGVSVLDEQGKVVHQWSKNTTGEDNLTGFRTCGIAINNDTVWVVCYHRGIDLFDLSFKKLKHFANSSDAYSLHDDIVISFFKDHKGTFWICGNQFLYKYLSARTGFKSYNLSKEVAGCSPREIAENKNGTLFIATVTGLIQFDPITEKYSSVTSSILEREQNTSSVAMDKNDGVWFLTDHHLVNYTPAENHFIVFGQEDGLDISKGLFELRTFNGTDFYLCQNDQVIKFNSTSIVHTITPPYLSVNVQANDSNVYSEGNNTAITLPYNKNKLQFEFIGTSYIKPNQNQYYYQLSDIDKQWNTTYKNSVSYANLDPGSYTFKVKTVNYAGIWSGDKILHFIIMPPYWQTWWFRTCILTVIFLILFFSIRYISQRNLKERILRLEKETAIEKERNRIAQDMHDDLGSGLTKIAILSEVVKQQMDEPQKAYEQLERISDSSRGLVDNLQDIIWLLNTKHDQVDSLAIYIREYATKYFEDSGVAISFDYPPHIEPLKIREEQRRNLFMAIKEALNNIIKHADASEVNVVLHVQKSMVEFIVSDNGEGFSPDGIRQFANGLKNMQNRMKQVGGACFISSEKGNGTSITYTLNL